MRFNFAEREKFALEFFRKEGVCVVGCDIGAKFSVFAVDGKTYKVEHSKLKEFKEKILKVADGRKIKIYLEQTGRYSLPVVETFLDCAELYLVEGKRVKAARELFSLPQKNDYYDARLLAIIGILPVPVIPLDYDAYTLRFLVNRMIRLEKSFQQAVNRLRQCIAVLFPGEYETFTKERLEQKRGKYLKQLKELLNGFVPFSAIQEELLIEAQNELQVIELLLKQRRQVEERIDLLCEKPHIKRDLEILTSFPGISKKRALIIKASYIDIRRFRNWKAFVKFMGYTKQENQSGTSVKFKKRINSNRLVRREMYMLCSFLCSQEGPASDLFSYYYLRTGGIFKKAVHKFSSKYLRLLFYCLKHGELFNPVFLINSLEDLISPQTIEELRRNVRRLREQRGKVKKKKEGSNGNSN